MPAFDLSGMYSELARSIPGYGNVASGQLEAQKVRSGQLDYEAKKEELEAARGLRKLFEQNPNAGIEEVARYSPAFAQDLMKSRLLMQKELLGMKETEQKMEKGQKEMSALDRQTVANTLGPIAEQALVSGDIERYKRTIGKAASDLQAQGIALPMNFDPAHHTPDAVLRNATGFGYKSPLIEQQMRVAGEQQMRQLPPGMSAEQAYGGVSMTPYGPMQVPPIQRPGMQAPMPQAQQPMQPQGQMRPAQAPEGYQKATAEDLPMLQQAYDQSTDLNEKQKIGALINQLKQQTGFITPEQISEMKAKEAGEKKKAELEAEKSMTQEQRAEVLSSLPERSEIESLIDESIASGAEQQLKGKLAPMVGISSKALEATKKLDVISPQLKSITKSLAGAGAISDFEQKMMADAAGAIADPNVPSEARKAAFRTFMDIMEKAGGKQAQKAGAGLQIGHEENGYIYKGGDPGKQSSWEKK